MSTPLKDIVSKVSDILGESISHIVIVCEGGHRIHVKGTADKKANNEIKLRPAALKKAEEISIYLASQDAPIQRKILLKRLNGNRATPDFNNALKYLKASRKAFSRDGFYADNRSKLAFSGNDNTGTSPS